MQFVHQTLTWGFLLALAPLVIHLINLVRRRRVKWAAMDFLKNAVKQSRKLIELRELLLMILRCLAVLLFVLAMSQPFWSGGSNAYKGEPVHAVLVIDNSLSMGYEEVGRTLLDILQILEVTLQFPRRPGLLLDVAHEDDAFGGEIFDM